MQDEERDAAHVWDMDEAARIIASLIDGVSLEQYVTDRKLQLAMERAVEILGEAARRVSESSRQRVPEIPWRAIIAQRNVLAHEYGDIDPRRMFALATRSVPDLRPMLARLLPPNAPDVP